MQKQFLFSFSPVPGGTQQINTNHGFETNYEDTDTNQLVKETKNTG